MLSIGDIWYSVEQPLRGESRERLDEKVEVDGMVVYGQL